MMKLIQIRIPDSVSDEDWEALADMLGDQSYDWLQEWGYEIKEFGKRAEVRQEPPREVDALWT